MSDLDPELLAVIDAAVDAAVARRLAPILDELGSLPARLEAALRETPNRDPDLDDSGIAPTVDYL